MKTLPLPTASRIELAAKEKGLLWKVLGVLCVPVCCVGCLCVVASAQLAKAAELYGRLVEFYGGVAAARRMAARVRNQAKLFDQAVIAVNSRGGDIDPRLTLLELVRHARPRFRTVCPSHHFLRGTHKAYNDAVWSAFIEAGGEPDVVVHGFIELILETADPTSTSAMAYADLILTNTSLKDEITRASCSSPA